MIDVLISLLEFVKDNRSDVIALLGQLNTMINVHQPYVNLSWMRSINGDDMLEINSVTEKLLHVSTNRLDLKYRANARITADYDSNLGNVKWKSDKNDIVSVDDTAIFRRKATERRQ